MENGTDPEVLQWSAERDREFARESAHWPHRTGWATAVTHTAVQHWAKPPVCRGLRQFVERLDPGDAFPVLWLCEPGVPARRLVAPLDLDPAGTLRVAAWRPSWEGHRLAYLLTRAGSDLAELHVLDIDEDRLSDGPITGIRSPSIAWRAGGDSFFYVRGTEPVDDDHPPGYRMRVLEHRVGTSTDHDEVVFDSSDPDAYHGLSIDRAGRRLAVTRTSGVSTTNQVWTTELAHRGGPGPWTSLVDGALGQRQPRFSPHGRLHLLSDVGAPRGRVLVPPEEHADTPWSEVLPESDSGQLDDCAWLVLPEAQYLLVLRVHGVISRLTVHDARNGRELDEVPLPGAGVVSGLRSRPEGGPDAWFSYTDPGTPPVLFHYDARKATLTRVDQAPQPDHGPPATTRHVTYPAQDGTPIDLHLLLPEGGTSGPRPLLLTGYGGFGAALRPVYSPIARAWTAAGGIHAIAGVRGGGDHGPAWHRAGCREHKITAVTDFVAAAAWLIDHGHTTSEQLATYGNSHGGLLVTAAMARRPDLFGAVAADGPLCDMIRYEGFGIGRTWTEEFGSASDPDQLRWLVSYSPYHSIRPDTDYPAVLLTGAASDERVGDAHARKMCAALQDANTGNSPVLLRRQHGTGHGPASTATAAATTIDTVTFLAHHTGLAPPQQHACTS